jgi:glycosyltransferase involved in cell wall biosynthesis
VLRALYLTYDGLTDPLGQSQILPYLSGLSAAGHQITIVSSEKPAPFSLKQSTLRKQTLDSALEWHPMNYHKKPPILSTIWDIFHMRRLAEKLHAKKAFDVVHCRSYLTSLVGLHLKRKYGVKFVFDMRGFWADERVDGGLWDPGRFPYSRVYRFFKSKERKFLQHADHVVSLTNAAKVEMTSWNVPTLNPENISVIPCCCDDELFDPTRIDPQSTRALRNALQLNEQDFVLSYLGSLGTWYLLDEMLGFFARLLRVYPAAKFLFITNDPNEKVFERASSLGISRESIRITSLPRCEVPIALALSALSISFIKPAYSKMSSSPTKLAEALSMDVPVVSNSGVGDVDWFHKHYSIGPLVQTLTPEAFDKAISELSGFLNQQSGTIRAVSLASCSLNFGVSRYLKIYSNLSS